MTVSKSEARKSLKLLNSNEHLSDLSHQGWLTNDKKLVYCMLVDFKLFYFSKEPKESEKIDPIKLAKKVEGSYDLAQFDFIFTLQPGENPYQKSEKKKGSRLQKRLSKHSSNEHAIVAFFLSVNNVGEAFVANTPQECAHWAKSLAKAGEVATGLTTADRVAKFESEKAAVSEQLKAHAKLLEDERIPKSERSQLQKQLETFALRLSNIELRLDQISKQEVTIYKLRRASAERLQPRRRSGEYRALHAEEPMDDLSDHELLRRVARQADLPAKKTRLCEECGTGKAVAKVRAVASDVAVKVCQSCLDRRSARGAILTSKSGATTSATSSQSSGVQRSKRRSSEFGAMQETVERSGSLMVGQARVPHWAVLHDYMLTWSRDKKALEPEGTIALGDPDTSVDMFDKIVFVQSGDQVYDFEASSKKEADAWVADITLAIYWASKIEKRTPLKRYRSRKVWPVRVLLELPTGSVRIVCNTEHTPDTIKKQLFSTARDRGVIGAAPSQFEQPDFYFLQFAGLDRVLIAEHEPISATNNIDLFRDSFAGLFLVAVSKLALREANIDLRQLLTSDGVLPDAPHVEPEMEQSRERSIQSLIAESLWHSLAAHGEDNDAEINVFRYRMAAVRLEAKAAIRDRLPEFVDSEPRPSPAPEQLTLSCYLPEVSGQKTVLIDASSRPSTVREQMFHKMVQAAGSSMGKRADDYVLKVLGKRSYFISELPLLDFDYIRACINRERPIALSLVEFDVRSALENEPASVVDLALAANLSWLGVSRESVPRAATPRQPPDSPSNTFTSVRRASDLAGAPLPAPTTLYDANSDPAATEWRNKARRGRVEAEVQERRVDRLHEMTVRDLPAEPFQCGVRAIHALKPANAKHTHTFVHAALIFGGMDLCPPCRSRVRELDLRTGIAEFDESCKPLSFQVNAGDIPKGTRITFTVYTTELNSDNAVPEAVAWGSVQIFDWNERYVSGERQLRLWPGAANTIGTCTGNFTDKMPVRLFVAFVRRAKTVVYVPPRAQSRAKGTITDGEAVPQHLLDVCNRDSLAELDETLKPELWKYRWALRTRPRALAKVLQCVRWWQPDEVAEAHQLIAKWRKLSSTDALELFDARYSDPVVRAYAVERLQQLSNGDLVDLLLQLVQVLKYEPYHDSHLSRFLLQRALEAKDIVGFPLFWHLRSEVHVPEISQRFQLLSESYLRGCGRVYRQTLVDQVRLLDELTAIATKLTLTPDHERSHYLRTALEDLVFPSRFSLPLFTDYECKNLIFDQCRYMKSKKLPLWLTFGNADMRGPPVTIMFKVGDDLRQDVLTLQMLKLMDKLWVAAGLQLGLSAYGVMSTGHERGLVEIVLDSETTANINRKAGGITKVLSSDTIAKWLRKNNPGDKEYQQAQRNFALSCAGYCVATYVLGVGDRHNDNIMISKQGHLFHIDFGHFLGHFKTKFGYEREKAPFVFTKQYAAVLGGKGAPMYQLFVKAACQAYLIVRRNAMLFVNLFTMMISVGLPELKSRDNVRYLVDQMALHLDDKQAVKHLVGLINESLSSKNTILGEMIHIAAN